MAWPSGGSAIFAGTGATVTATFPGPDVTSMTFNSAGYFITDGWINTSGPTLTVTTNQSATIDATLSGSFNSTLVKEGTAALSISGTIFLDNVQVNAGEFVVGATSNLFFSNTTIASGAVVTLAQSSSITDIRSLSGNGVLQPSATARTVAATIWAAGTFRGVAQDNGSGILGLEVFATGSAVTLAGNNSYSGATKIRSGTLSFSENGSALNSAVNIFSGGTLRLDNTTTALTNRLSDSADVTIENGRIEFAGHSATALEENLGALKFSGAIAVNAAQSGATAALLTFASATRQNQGTIDFSGNGRVKWTGMANDSAGIIGAYATAGNEWAMVGADGRVDALTAYASDLNAAGTGNHVKLIGGGTNDPRDIRNPRDPEPPK